MDALVPVTVNAATGETVTRLGVAQPTYTTTAGLYAYWLLVSSQTTDPVVGSYTETGQLAVPSTFPDVKPGDRITVDGRDWDVDGHPVDYALGPFTDRWINLTGEPPVTVVHLRREVFHVEEGS